MHVGSLLRVEETIGMGVVKVLEVAVIDDQD
jgi:hypothetical protein